MRGSNPSCAFGEESRRGTRRERGRQTVPFVLFVCFFLTASPLASSETLYSPLAQAPTPPPRPRRRPQRAVGGGSERAQAESGSRATGRPAAGPGGRSHGPQGGTPAPAPPPGPSGVEGEVRLCGLSGNGTSGASGGVEASVGRRVAGLPPFS